MSDILKYIIETMEYIWTNPFTGVMVMFAVLIQAMLWFTTNRQVLYWFSTGFAAQVLILVTGLMISERDISYHVYYYFILFLFPWLLIGMIWKPRGEKKNEERLMELAELIEESQAAKEKLQKEFDQRVKRITNLKKTLRNLKGRIDKRHADTSRYREITKKLERRLAKATRVSENLQDKIIQEEDKKTELLKEKKTTLREANVIYSLQSKENSELKEELAAVLEENRRLRAGAGLSQIVIGEPVPVIIYGRPKGKHSHREVQEECSRLNIRIVEWFEPDKNEKMDYRKLKNLIQNNDVRWLIRIIGGTRHEKHGFQLKDLTAGSGCEVFTVPDSSLSKKIIRDFYYSCIRPSYDNKRLDWAKEGFQRYLSEAPSEYRNDKEAIRIIENILSGFSGVLAETFLAMRRLGGSSSYLKEVLESAFIYFFNPNDMIPLRNNPLYGYVDDIYVFCLALDKYYIYFRETPPSWFPELMENCRLMLPGEVQKELLAYIEQSPGVKSEDE